MTLFQRAQITPRFDAVVEPGGAGAGPVRGEAGLAALGVFGIVLIALGLLFLVMLAVAHSPIPLIWAILILVIGVVLFVYDGRGTSHRL
jgi:hypothetical protein